MLATLLHSARSRFFDLDRASLSDVGLTSEASLNSFVAVVRKHFKLSELSADMVALAPSLGDIMRLISNKSGSPISMGRMIVCLLLATTAMASATSCASKAPNQATLFTYEEFTGYTMVNSTQCGESYVLYPRGTTPPDVGTGVKYFGVPLESVVVTQTPPVAFLETIGEREAISVASAYTTSPCMAKRIADEDASLFMNTYDFGYNNVTMAATLADASNEAIFTDPYGHSSWSYTASADKVICEASTYEETPEGQAEWLKFFGYFFGKSQEAAEGFCATASRYECNALAASSIVSEAAKIGSTSEFAYRVPTALFAAKGYYGDYTIQMTPYKNQLVQDAGAVYPDLSAFEAFKSMHWTGAYVSGYSFPPESIADFHAAIALADVIIDETYGAGKTLAEVSADYGFNVNMTETKAFTDGRVYRNDGTMDSRGAPWGGIDWFESRIAEPDGLLSDLIAVLHPTDANYEPAGLTFLRHAANGVISVKTADMCTDVSAPRPVRAATCAEIAANNINVITAFNELEPLVDDIQSQEGDGDDDGDKNAGLTAAVIVLGVVAAGAILAALVIHVKSRPSPKAVGPATVSA